MKYIQNSDLLYTGNTANIIYTFDTPKIIFTPNITIQNPVTKRMLQTLTVKPQPTTP